MVDEEGSTPRARVPRAGAPIGSWDDLFRQSPVPTAVLRGEHYIWANPPFGELTGRDAAEIPGLSYEAFQAGIDDEEIQQSFEVFSTGGRRARMHGYLGSGERRWVRIELTLLETDPPPADPSEQLTLLQVVDLTDLQEAKLALTASENRLRSLLGSIDDAITVTDAAGRVQFTSGGEGATLAYDPATWADSLVHPEDRGRAVAAWARAMAAPGEEITDELRMRTTDGGWAHIGATVVNLLEDPDVGGVVVTTRNLTELRRAEHLAAGQNRVLELIARGGALQDVLHECARLVDDNTDTGGSSWITILEGDRQEIRAGNTPTDLVAWFREPDRPATIVDVAFGRGEPVVVHDVQALDVDPRLQEVAAELGARAGWALPVFGPGGRRPVGALATLYDHPYAPTERERAIAELAASLVSIALVRAANEERLSFQALHDELTGLPNRTLLTDRLEHALERRSRSGSGVAVLFCDLDRFKIVNDSLGHGIGDELLVSFAERLEGLVDAGDTVARFGGDEFVILLEEVPDEHHPVAMAERIARALQEPFQLAGGQEVHLTASIGVTTSTEHVSGDAWLRDADAAMYEAKERGRNRFEVFDAQIRASAVARLEIQTDLRQALRRGELVLHYQPVVNLRTGRISGAEALVRWQHPRRGLLPPMDFVPVAEDLGLIHELGAQVLDMAVRDLAGLRDRLPHPFQLGVNLSALQLTNLALPEEVELACRRHGWPLDDLLLEVTEGALAEQAASAVDVLARIHLLGVDLAIDDFGTGHSSLDRLGRMPVDQVKIDRSFVGAVDLDDRRLVRIVDAVVGIAEALDLLTSAEGVETTSQLEYLRSVGCDYAQGYLFAKPLRLHELEDLIEAGPRW